MQTSLVGFLKERMMQSCRCTIIDMHNTPMYVYYVQVLGDGNIAILHRKFWRNASPSPCGWRLWDGGKITPVGSLSFLFFGKSVAYLVVVCR